MSKTGNLVKHTSVYTHQKTRLLTYTAIFAAMITVMTAYVAHVPTGVNGGYIHFGDSLIYLAAAFLPTPYALAAAAIGGGLADLLTAPVWAPATILIKMMIAALFTAKKDRFVNPRNVAAAVFALLITCGGYFLAELILFGTGEAGFLAAMTLSVGGNLIQGIGSAVFFIFFGIFLDRMGFKKRVRL